MPAKIPQVQTGDKNFVLFQTQLGKALQPILDNPVNFGLILPSVSLLASATNVVNHGLNRKLIGYIITRQRAQSSIWDSQDVNPQPNVSLLLNVSADVTVDLLVF